MVWLNQTHTMDLELVRNSCKQYEKNWSTFNLSYIMLLFSLDVILHDIFYKYTFTGLDLITKDLYSGLIQT